MIQKNGKEVARLISRDSTVNFLTDSIRGVLKKDYDDKKLRMEKSNIPAITPQEFLKIIE